MPIEYDCPQCGAHLRVPDEAAGAKGRCPRCGALSDVPEQPVDAVLADAPGQEVASGPGEDDRGTAPGVDTSWAGDSEVAEDDPYRAAPAVGTGAAVQPRTPDAAIPTDVDGIARHAWGVWKEHLALLVGVTLIVGGIEYVLRFIAERLDAAGAPQGIVLIVVLLSAFVQAGLGAGNLIIALKLVRGQPAGLDDLPAGFSRALPLLVGGVLLALVFVIGFALLVIPGIILVLRLWPYQFLIVEARGGLLEPFSIAWEMTSGHWGLPILLWLLSMVALVLGLLACGIGLLLAAPYVVVLWTTAYVALYDEWRRAH